MDIDTRVCTLVTHDKKKTTMMRTVIIMFLEVFILNVSIVSQGH